MSFWSIVFIVCIVAMVVGPIAMLQPSHRDKRLSGLRQAAAQKRLRVRLASIQLSSAKKSIALYSVSLPKTEQTRGAWSLIKQSFTHGLHFQGQWDWADKQHVAPETYHQSIRQRVDSLDASICGIEVTPISVGVYWTEEGLTIDEIEALLLSLQAVLSD
ncbi:MAG: hypothetical protein ACI9NY_000947 [Kiritimatiellia bacterium]|jgi:hypothetical protein